MRPRVTAIVAGVLALLVGAGFVRAVALDPREVLVHRGTPEFQMLYDEDVLRPAEPRGDEMTRLAGGRGRLSVTVTVRPFRPRRQLALPPLAALPVYGHRHIVALGESHRALDVTGEGHLRVNWAPGYEIWFRQGRGRRRVNGRDVIVFPDEQTGTGGVVLSLRRRGPRGPGTETLVNEAHRTLRSFTFGLD